MSIQLAPEIEAEVRAEAAALGISVDALISTAVKTYLRNEILRPARRLPLQDRSAEMAWAANPDARYVGKWVALTGNEVIATGSNAKEVYDEVRAKGYSSPFLIFVSPDEQQPFAGGWID